VLRRLARRSLPQTEGTAALPCLEAPVEVVRDRFGIPHIFGRTRRDVARAQGYVHAQDRLFQMESLRRFAFGRLAELVGSRALEVDRVARRMRLRWAAERDAAACDAEVTAIAEAYCEGVNAFLAHGPLPLELRLLRARPEPWTAIDVQAPAQMFALALSGNWGAELARARIAARVGEERMRRLDLGYPPEHPLIIEPRAAVRGLRIGRTLRERLGMGASNSFAVAGSRTAGGAPILANDPHLLLGAPCVWHAQHVAWDGGEWAGFTVAGAPALILGRNRRLAWGMTTAMLDTQDLFVERLHPTDATRYEVDGDWVEGEVVREEIRVRGRRAPAVEEFLVTRHGPVVVDPEPGGDEALALAWSSHEPGETSRALLDLEVAGSVEEAERALDRFAAPPHNFTLADADGSIAYRLAGGPIPRRRSGDGSAPTPGWDSSLGWDGYLAQEELPRRRDPERGFVVTANNRISEDERLTGEFLSGYRARRIETLLAERDRVGAEDCWSILLDRLSLPGLELVEALRGFTSEDPLEQRVLDVLAAWDGELGPESEGGAVFGALMRSLEREAYADAGTDPLSGEPDALPTGLFERARPAVIRAVAERDDSFFAPGRTAEDVVRAALAAAVRMLGPDPVLWRRGRFHRVRFAHGLDPVPGLRRVFSRGPYPVGGDADTVNVMARVPGVGPGSMIGAAMRAVFDLGDADGSLVSLVPGQSGHPASPHYDGLLPGWLRGEAVPLVMSRARVEDLAEARLVLQPE
jgi:penicillin G amidase